jgi:lysozyme
MVRRLICLAAGLLVLGAPAANAAPANPRLPGIDVSRFQGLIDWPAVGESGVRFAFVQASRGSGKDCTVRPDRCGYDEHYLANYTEAKAEGVRVGPYHRAFVGGDGPAGVKADARAEARTFLYVVGELEPGDLRPALDMEVPFDDLTPVELRIWTRTWLKRVQRTLGVRPIIYTNTSSWSLLGNPTSFAVDGHPLWVANWDVGAPSVPAQDWAGRSWRVWQHSSAGHIRGIEGRVDLDWLRGGWRGVTVRGAGGGIAP